MRVTIFYRTLVCILLGTLCLYSCQSSSGELASSNKPLPKKVDFNFHIKPILSDRCFTCHGPDENTRKADLRFDLEEGAFALLDTADNRYAIVPGSLSKSELVRRMHSKDPEMVMPPPESNLTLSSYEIALLEKWIEQGAEWKTHWSFIAPEKSELPQVRNLDWVSNEIDHFVLSKLQEANLQTAEPESKEKLLRRISFDLTGLPPTPEELKAFQEDETSNAYEKQIDRLLASPAYGERMASIWLEASRYADSHGYQDDRPRTIWPWRDWVIKAYNQNLSYKDFIIWQLAGDLLPDATYEQKLATAFNRNHAITQEGGVINEEYVTEYVADRTNTVSAAFLGLTMECARCHDHKYDPISQKDYYQMFAFFNGIDERGQVNYFDKAPSPNIQMEDENLEATIAYLDSLRNNKEVELQELQAKPQNTFDQWLQKDYAKIDMEAQIKQGLLAYFKLDQFEQLATPNELVDGLPGKVNVKILSELIVPKWERGGSLERRCNLMVKTTSVWEM